jgi:hypothetical protein
MALGNPADIFRENFDDGRPFNLPQHINGKCLGDEIVYQRKGDLPVAALFEACDQHLLLVVADTGEDCVLPLFYFPYNVVQQSLIDDLPFLDAPEIGIVFRPENFKCDYLAGNPAGPDECLHFTFNVKFIDLKHQVTPRETEEEKREEKICNYLFQWITIQVPSGRGANVNNFRTESYNYSCLDPLSFQGRSR